MATEKRLIDANALIDRMVILCDEYGIDDCTFDNICCEIEQAPTVDAVEVVHGRWKVSRESEISRNVWCTACGEDFYMHRKGVLQIDKMPYCPSCGAKMDLKG